MSEHLRNQAHSTPASAPQPQLQRRLGILNATSINMSNMIGIGPFITVPPILATMGGPQALIAWFVGALLAICDGLVVSELGAALPGVGRALRVPARQLRAGALGQADGLDVHLAISLFGHAGNCLGKHRHGAVPELPLEGPGAASLAASSSWRLGFPPWSCIRCTGRSRTWRG